MRRLWLAIYLPSLLIASGQQAVVIMLPLYAAALYGAREAAGLAAMLLALRAAGSLFANVPAGLLVARLGDKAVMLGSLMLLAAAAAALALAVHLHSHVLLTCVAAVALGAGSGGWLLARLAYVTEAAPLAFRGRALAGLGAMQRVGLLIGPLLGGTMVELFGFDVAFLAASVSTLVAMLLIVPYTRGNAAPSRLDTGPGLSSLLKVLVEHRRVFATAGVSVSSLALLRASRQLLIPLWGALLGLGPQQIGVTFMLSSAIEIAMAYPAGALIDRRGHKAAAIPCFVLLAASILLLPLARDWPTLIAVAVLAGVGNGFGAGIMMTFGSDYAPPAQRGEFLGVWRMMGDAGQVAGPALIGGVAAVTSLAVATMGAGVVGIAGLALMVFAVRAPTRA